MGVLPRGLATRIFRFTPLLAGRRVDVGRDVRVIGAVWLAPGQGRVRIGDGVRITGRRAAVELRAHDGAEIVIGDGAVIEDGVSIEAMASVRIGARARLGAFCKIVDARSQQAPGERPTRPHATPVIVGEGAIVGPRAVLLPGAGLGALARLGPSVVLSFRVPDGADFPGTQGAGDRAE